MLVFHDTSLIICILGVQRTYTFPLVSFMQIFRQRWLLRLTVLLLSISLHLIWNKIPIELNFGIQVFIYRLWWKIQFSSFPLSIVLFVFCFFFLLNGKKKCCTSASSSNIPWLAKSDSSSKVNFRSSGVKRRWVMLHWPSFHLPK